MDHSWLKLVHKIGIPQIGDIIFRTTVNILKIAWLEINVFNMPIYWLIDSSIPLNLIRKKGDCK